MHLRVEVDGARGTLVPERPWQDRLLDIGGRQHFLMAVLLFADLRGHLGEDPGKVCRLALLADQLA
jgi:hypothetical protein